jgi:hypothetical protein
MVLYSALRCLLLLKNVADDNIKYIYVLDLYLLYVLVCSTGRMILTVDTNYSEQTLSCFPLFAAQIVHTEWTGTETTPAA